MFFKVFNIDYDHNHRQRVLSGMFEQKLTQAVNYNNQIVIRALVVHFNHLQQRQYNSSGDS